VQFSFADDNTILSESIEGLVNMITDSVGSVFSAKCYLRRSSYPKAIVIWVESDATSWVKTFIRYPKYVIIWKISTKAKYSEALRTTKVVIFTKPRGVVYHQAIE
jgi:hypothetical protein